MAETRPRCLVCGIRDGNSAYIQVLSFSLIRSSRGRTRSYGTIALCDRCRRENSIQPEALPAEKAPRRSGANFTLAAG